MANQEGRPIFAKHSDVMHAKPADSESKQRLLDEVKRRGNEAFKQHSLQEAEALYTRAIELDSNGHTLYSNRSAARSGMNKLDLALEDALTCITMEPKWAKGYFRKGQALMKMKQYGAAYVAFEQSLDLEPSNKGTAKQLELAKTQAQAAGQALVAYDPEQVKVGTSVPQQPSNASSKSTTTKPTTKREKPVKVKETELKDLTGHIKGYKTLADGRKTTFFNNELTEETRALIGDIAPKKIERAEHVQIEKVEGGSAWNQGSTFEEKDVSAGARARLTALLEATETFTQGQTLVIQLDKVSTVTGDASIAVSRGKKRYIFDYTFELEVTGTMVNEDSKSASGTIKFLDMSSDCNREYDVEVVVPSRYDTEAGKMLHSFLTNDSLETFRSKINAQLHQFETEFYAM